MKHHQRRRTSQQRAVRTLRPRLLVVCGGKRTEPDYLDALKRAYLSQATVVIRARGSDPIKCVEYAARQSQSEDPAFDEVWCVLDVDQFDIDSARKKAGETGVVLAVSNPCFELWLLLHLVDVSRPFADCKDVRRELVKALPAYDKVRLLFDDFQPGVDKAIDRARRLEQRCAANLELTNPSSEMWRLAARIVGGGPTV